MSLLDLIFPKRCVSCSRFGAYICRRCFSQIQYIREPVCPVCQRQAVGGRTHQACRSRYRLDGLVVICRYHGPVRKAIVQVKYKLVYDIERVFVNLTADNLWRFDLPKNLVVVPVPLHSKRKKWRGFNQAEILAKSLAKSFKVDFAELLIRVIDTKTQVGLKRDERRKNVKGAFALKSGESVKGKNVLLVDDVYTSGATMGECCRVLKRAGAGEVWGMAVALG